MATSSLLILATIVSSEQRLNPLPDLSSPTTPPHLLLPPATLPNASTFLSLPSRHGGFCLSSSLPKPFSRVCLPKGKKRQDKGVGGVHAGRTGERQKRRRAVLVMVWGSAGTEVALAMVTPSTYATPQLNLTGSRFFGCCFVFR